jgi:hypothetical protein
MTQIPNENDPASKEGANGSGQVRSEEVEKLRR